MLQGVISKKTFCFPESGFRFDFAIFIAGFRSRSSQHQSMYEQTITLPSLHVFGDTDQVIPKGKHDANY